MAVTFHEAFWIVTGTAAPIIALAAVVAIGDADRAGDRANALARDVQNADERVSDRLYADGLPFRPGRRGRPTSPDVRARTYYGVFWLLGNCLVQAALLAVSLLSIAHGSNLVPPWIAVTASVGGIVLLTFEGLAASSASTVIERWRREFEDSVRAEKPKHSVSQGQGGDYAENEYGAAGVGDSQPGVGRPAQEKGAMLASDDPDYGQPA